MLARIDMATRTTNRIRQKEYDNNPTFLLYLAATKISSPAFLQRETAIFRCLNGRMDLVAVYLVITKPMWEFPDCEND